MHENTPSTRRGTQLGLIVSTLCVLLATTVAEGALIDIQITGLDAKYDADEGAIFDAGSIDRVTDQSVANAVLVDSVDFYRDDVLMGRLQSGEDENVDFYVDLLIKEVPQIPVAGGKATANNEGTFGFDLLQKTEAGITKLLSLTLGEMTVGYNPTDSDTAFFTQASAVGFADKVDAQDLPFVDELDDAELVGLWLGGPVTSPIDNNDPLKGVNRWFGGEGVR